MYKQYERVKKKVFFSFFPQSVSEWPEASEKKLEWSCRLKIQKLCLDVILLLCAAPAKGCLEAQIQLGCWLRKSRAATDSSCSGGCVCGVSKQELPWMCKCMRAHAPASSWLSCRPLAVLHYCLVRFPAHKGPHSCVHPASPAVLACASTGQHQCRVFRLASCLTDGKADCWRQPSE